MPDAADAIGQFDHKTQLQELAARLGSGAPVYEVSSHGPDHAKTFRATVLVDGDVLGVGTGRSKKAAEQVAADRGLPRPRLSRRRDGDPRCLSCPRSRPSGAGCERHLVGRRIERVEVGRERTVRRTSREAVIAGLSDTVVEAAERRGKYLLLPLDSGDT